MGKFISGLSGGSEEQAAQYRAEHATQPIVLPPAPKIVIPASPKPLPPAPPPPGVANEDAFQAGQDQRMQNAKRRGILNTTYAGDTGGTGGKKAILG